jgi:hypothetical protein
MGGFSVSTGTFVITAQCPRTNLCVPREKRSRQTAGEHHTHETNVVTGNSSICSLLSYRIWEFGMHAGLRRGPGASAMGVHVVSLSWSHVTVTACVWCTVVSFCLGTWQTFFRVLLWCCCVVTNKPALLQANNRHATEKWQCVPGYGTAAFIGFLGIQSGFFESC